LRFDLQQLERFVVVVIENAAGVGTVIATAISVTGSPEVSVVRMASGRQCGSSAAHTARLSARSSASIHGQIIP
jgi:hypothetical protein